MHPRRGFQQPIGSQSNKERQTPKRKDQVASKPLPQQHIMPKSIQANSAIQPQIKTIVPQSQQVQKPNVIVHQKLRYPPIRHELLKHYGIRSTTDDDQIADIIFPSLRLAFIVVGIENVILPNYSEQLQPTMTQHHSSQVTDFSKLRKATLEDICSIGSIFERSFVMVMINNKNHLGKFVMLQNMLTSHVIQRQTNRELYLKTHDHQSIINGKRKREDPNAASSNTNTDMESLAPYRPPQILPCSSTSKMIQCIQELSKVEGRKQRVKHSEKELEEFMNQHQATAERAFVNSSIAHGLSSYEASVLLQGMGSVSKVILCESPQEIMNRTPLEKGKAKLIFEFFNPSQYSHDQESEMLDE
ncbi:hypothetical protein C9374_010915 [Naegleria lovaniensis]|uniref:Uncharacterized protein n=1 Tax=Naegleria lovaniensis TaxID=51637 RepID=A0AA88KD19_NAELO|nr:uncharacterized protein C9374_010915 [Naegleria lovaniensis]KAG2374345.1 hypothetical protein C9374_010915 [Naegleria lovaniensis]